jgi:DNA polymerase-3 subunit alpha
MVISPVPLDEYYGVFDKDGENCLMIDMEEAHEVGAAKYDFLVLKTVQVIRDTCRYLGVDYPKTHEINWDDQDVWEDMARNSTAIFQFEGGYASECLRKYKPQSIFDMSLVTACIRPSGASYRDNLLAKKPNRNPSKMIDDLLAENNGYLVYQEDVIKFLQQICGLTGSEADNIRRAIGRKDRDRLEKAMPQIMEGYCGKSDKPRAEAEAEAKEFLQILEDSASYMFGMNHSVAYCLLGYLCAYYRYYHPVEFITAFLNDAANDDDIRNGTELASKKGIRVTMPKWGVSRSDYAFDLQNKTIAKGHASIKYMSGTVAEELYRLSEKKYSRFVDLLHDIDFDTHVDQRQLEILIKLDYFDVFGNQRELLRINELYTGMFKRGQAKQIKKSAVDGTPLEPIITKYAVGVTKSAGEAKSYTLLDVRSIMQETEDLVKASGFKDLSDIAKVQNFYDMMGYLGYTTGKDEDRRKLFVMDVKPLFRKADGKEFGASIYTKSIGSGKESRFTVFNRTLRDDPIQKNDIILCKGFVRDGAYFTLTAYERIIS